MDNEKTNGPAATDRLNSLVRPFGDWLADKEAEYSMSGLGKKEAKEKAMEDWYLYQEPNVPPLSERACER